MHIAVIGGGLMGMTLAYFLSESGQRVTVLEQSGTAGGINQTVQLENSLSIARYQHNIFPGDINTIKLLKRLGLERELLFRPAHSGIFHHGHIYPLRSIWDFLKFAPLRLRDRLRLGQTIVQAQLTNDWQALDQVPVRDWLVAVGGRQNFEHIWAPLLEAKFDHQYANIPATFIWSWLNRAVGMRRAPQLKASVGYLRQGPEALVQALADAVVRRGNEFLTQTRVREIELYDGQLGRVRTHTGILEFDAVVAAVPTPEFSRMLLSADETYLHTLGHARYLGLICPALVLEQPLSDYWTLNLTDPTSPFSTIVEIPYPEDPRYHVMYLPKYTAPDNDWMGVPDDTIREAWLLRLRQIYPTLRPEHIKHFVVSRTRYVDPLHFLNAAERIPAVETPYRGLYLANTSQVYPELATSEAVIAHANRIAQQIIKQGAFQRIAEPAA